MNKTIYERTKKSYGSKNSLTKEARGRYEQAKTRYAVACRENRAAKSRLLENREEIESTQREVDVDKISENKN